MKCKVVGILVSVVVFAIGYFLGGQAASARFRSETIKLKGEAEIYRVEADKYAQTLRDIRQTAAQATVAEMAPQA